MAGGALVLALAEVFARYFDLLKARMQMSF